MSNLNPVFIPLIVSDRWAEAVAKNDVSTWRACAYLAGFEADVIEKHEPNHVLVPMLRGISMQAHDNYLNLMPKEVMQ